MTDSNQSAGVHARIVALRARAARIIEGSAEGCYDEEFARAIAIAMEVDGGKAEVISVYRRLQDKFRKEFAVSQLKAMVDEIRKKMRIAAQPKREPIEGWKRSLLRKRRADDEPGQATGAVLLNENNAMLYFENHPDWAGVLGYNQFTAEHAVLKDPPEPVHVKAGEFLQDHHDVQLTRWLQQTTTDSWNVDMVRRAVDAYAREHGFHPIRDFLDGLTWDGKDRLKTWLFDYAGAGPAEGDEGSSEPATAEYEARLADYVAAAGERWMISAVARVRNPGCEVHHMLVLEGGEGVGKSMLVKKIGKGYSQVMTGALDGRGAQELVASAVWIWEFAELASLKKTQEVESAKAFITRPEETFRPAYGHRVIRHKRECAFIATANNDEYLDSSAWEDGKRRIWPIKCTRPFDLDGLEEVIDQLWAEADFKFKAGVRWHFDAGEDTALITTAKEEQKARVSENPNAGAFLSAALRCVGRNMTFPDSVSIEEVLEEMKTPVGRDRKMLAGDCAKALKDSWRKFRPRLENGVQLRRYKRPD